MHYLKRLSTWHLIIAMLVITLLGFTVAYGYASKNSNMTVSGSICEGTCIFLNENGASPDSIAVAAGSYVQFNSADGKPHNLSIGKGGHDHNHSGKFYSGEFQADEGWRVQLNDEGSFYFHDHLNPKINVLVVVYTPDKDYKIQ